MTLVPDAFDAIQIDPWPGNVRELENCISRAIIIADGTAIKDAGLNPKGINREFILNLRLVRDKVERQAIARVLGRINGNLSNSTEMFGIGRPTRYERLEHRRLR